MRWYEVLFAVGTWCSRDICSSGLKLPNPHDPMMQQTITRCHFMWSFSHLHRLVLYHGKANVFYSLLLYSIWFLSHFSSHYRLHVQSSTHDHWSQLGCFHLSQIVSPVELNQMLSWKGCKMASVKRPETGADINWKHRIVEIERRHWL